MTRDNEQGGIMISPMQERSETAAWVGALLQEEAMRPSDGLEIGYLDVLSGLVDGREQARYVPHMRPTGSCGGCGTPTSPERPCGYCGGDGGAWY